MRPCPVKVLIVDDSPAVRTVLMRVLSGQDGILVAGGAKDAFEARELVLQHRPDVIVLDIEMPRMSGVAFLKKLMAHYPVPVIMCTDSGSAQSQAALDALELGATAVVVKPPATNRGALRKLGEELAEHIRTAAVALKRPPPLPVPVLHTPVSLRSAGLNPAHFLVAIGASTGGTEAIKELLQHVPEDFPPAVIVQHMPEEFTASFADRLDHYSPLAVHEARDGERLAPGVVLVARGGVQMTVGGNIGAWRVHYGTSAPVNRHCPSVDVLFDSVVRAAGRRAVGVLLTGMGADGARGLLNLKNAGALTIGQNADSCVVYGMPKVAADLGAVQVTGAPADIPALMVQTLRAARQPVGIEGP